MELILTQEEAEKILLDHFKDKFPSFNTCNIDKEYSYSRIVCTLSVKEPKDDPVSQ
jgi:hypothetical protein